jgi:hypothetical protein
MGRIDENSFLIDVLECDRYGGRMRIGVGRIMASEPARFQAHILGERAR